MSVLRAILGRFARFLVRMARRLDPAITPAAAWTMTERMAALRRRYPGAPDHWLKLIASRAPLDPAPEPEEPPAGPYANEAHFPSGDPPRIAAPAFASRKQSAHGHTLFFRRFEPKARPAIHASTAGPEERGGLPLPSIERRVAKPSLTFSPRHLRNPIARLLRLDRFERRRALLHLESDDGTRRPVDDTRADQPEWTARARPAFPGGDARATPQRPWFDAPDAPSRAAEPDDPRWPTLRRVAPEPVWQSTPAHVRPDQPFNITDNRWPDLPQLPVDSSAPLLSARDEAALRAEQLGGTWSA
jgi:hypothetical protein